MANCAGNLLVRAKRYEDADEYYRKALKIAPENIEFLCNRAACLIKMMAYGEADELLSKAHSIAPSPRILELIAFIANEKGEYARAEAACKSALEMDPHYLPCLFFLGWIYVKLRRWSRLKSVLDALHGLRLSTEDAKQRKDLRAKYEESLK
jgi:tetratricopeptide (TPR) repeat protein